MKKPPSEIRTAAEARAALQAFANPEKARFLAGFFKTGKGQYAEGDRFLGITVPAIRTVAKQFRNLPLADCEQLLGSEYNDERLLSLLILSGLYQKGDGETQERIFRMYVRNRKFVSNWNLVDSSAPQIVGAHLQKRDRDLLYQLVRSESLWDRRIAIIATFTFIRENDFADTLKITELLLEDKHDLIHKACGWMLREVGKRNQPVLEKFLQQHCCTMPRTMLRYAIERFSPTLRQSYLEGTVHPT